MSCIFGTGLSAQAQNDDGTLVVFADELTYAQVRGPNGGQMAEMMNPTRQRRSVCQSSVACRVLAVVGRDSCVRASGDVPASTRSTYKSSMIMWPSVTQGEVDE